MSALLDERIRELQANRSRGGSWMARRAIEALVEVAHQGAASGDELFEELTDAARKLAGARSSVAAIAGALGRLLAPARSWSDVDAEEFCRRLEQEAQALLDSRDRAPAAIAIQLRERLDDALVFTHSASATVKEALLRTPPERVLCTVSRPFEEGVAFADELREEGLTVDLVEDDDAVGRLGEASLLLLGADSVYLDGSLLNKVGTRRLAEGAAGYGIQAVVACEVIKVAPFEHEAAPADETIDLTPPELIEFFVTEEGGFHPDEIRSLADRTPFLRDGYAVLQGHEV